MLTLEELEYGRCKWPLDEAEPRVFLFCGEPTFQTKPYCLCHCALAYESEATRRRRAAEWAAARPNAPTAERARRWNAYLGQGAEKVRDLEPAREG